MWLIFNVYKLLSGIEGHHLWQCIVGKHLKKLKPHKYAIVFTSIAVYVDIFIKKYETIKWIK